MTDPEAVDPPLTLSSPDALHRQLRDMLENVADVFEVATVPYFLCAGTALGARRDGDLIPWDFDVDLMIPLEHYSRALEVLTASLPTRYAVKDPRRHREYEHLFGRVHLAAVHHKYAHVDLFPLGGTFGSRRAQHAHLVLSKLLRHALYRRTRATLPGGLDGQGPLTRAVAPWVARLLPRAAILWLFDRVCTLRDSRRARHLTNLTAGYLEREALPRAFFNGEGSAQIAGRTYPCPSPIDDYLRRLYGAFLDPPPDSERQRLLAFFDEWYLPALSTVPVDTDS
jgi:lipopolysaccharide cholinephosphotransferase